MKPHRRQMRLQWLVTIDEPHISQRGSVASLSSRAPWWAASLIGPRTSGTGGNAGPSRFMSIGSPLRKSPIANP
jgi:hypothetical protein